MLRGALAGCLGVYAKHCTQEEVRQVLLRGPLAAPAAPSKWDRLGHALTLAATAASAPERCATAAAVKAVRVLRFFFRGFQGIFLGRFVWASCATCRGAVAPEPLQNQLIST